MSLLCFVYSKSVTTLQSTYQPISCTSGIDSYFQRYNLQFGLFLKKNVSHYLFPIRTFQKKFLMSIFFSLELQQSSEN